MTNVALYIDTVNVPNFLSINILLFIKIGEFEFLTLLFCCFLFETCFYFSIILNLEPIEMMENESLTGKKWRWEQIPARHDKKIGRGEGKRVRRYVIKIRLIVPMGCNGLLGAICLHSVSLQSLTLSSVYSTIEVALIKINHCKLPIEVK